MTVFTLSYSGADGSVRVFPLANCLSLTITDTPSLQGPLLPLSSLFVPPGGVEKEEDSVLVMVKVIHGMA